MALRRQREKVEQAQIVQLLRSIGGTVYVLGTRRREGDYQGTMQTPGLPDLLAFLPNHAMDGARLLFVECKASGGRVSEAQADFRALCQLADCACGSIEHVVGDLNAVIEWLVWRGYVKAEQFPYYRQPKERQR